MRDLGRQYDFTHDILLVAELADHPPLVGDSSHECDRT